MKIYRRVYKNNQTANLSDIFAWLTNTVAQLLDLYIKQFAQETLTKFLFRQNIC